MAQYVEGQATAPHRGCFFYGCITVLAIIVVVVGGVGACVWVGYSGQGSVRRAAESYLVATAKGDYLDAYELLSRGWRERVEAGEYVRLETAAASSRGSCEDRTMSSVNVRKSTGQVTRAEVGYDATCGGAPTRVNLTLVREQGQWRVDAVDYHSRSELGPLRCPECGALNPPGANFCARCGKPLRPAEAPEVPPAPRDPNGG